MTPRKVRPLDNPWVGPTGAIWLGMYAKLGRRNWHYYEIRVSPRGSVKCWEDRRQIRAPKTIVDLISASRVEDVRRRNCAGK